ncbi:MAG: ATP-dependent RNA helicase SrmB [Aeromonadaceae bacterium]|jgi:ATP-dependent RNA helicase SrmB|nr:ATP-dependent RNA helicase SrmB [Aeromonadaceae bacterium]MBP8772690.1 ATP-dependent RNA helicase SrmB [Aeromonadaceae bacterium]
MSFDNLDLDSSLLRAVAEQGFVRPTTIQQQVIPVAMDGRDILASAPTGTGKTAAFLLPTLQHLLDYPRRRAGSARVLILTPTRELALQITEHAKALAAHTHLVIASIIGGVGHDKQLPALTETTDIIVATPGRLMEYIEAESFDSRAIEILIIDEADRMLDMGFIGEVDRIVGEARWRKQTMLFSATLEGTGLVKFANEVLTEPAELTAESPRSERRKIQQLMYLADSPEHKFALLCHLLRSEEVKRSILFVKTRERLAELSAQLQASGINCAWIRGEMEQEKRVEAIRRFRNEEVNVLVATDVAARGIDLPDVSHVINVDLPRTADVYVHRIGRTGRAGKRGVAISLVEAHDMPMLGRIERYTEEELRRRVIDELRPQHKTAKVTGKKKPDAKKEKRKEQDKRKAAEAEEPRKKERLRDKKNKGKPDWAKKKAAKEAAAAAKEKKQNGE